MQPGCDYCKVATAFETIYFWPDIEKSYAEVKRVLAPGGKFLIVNEDDGLSGNNEKWENLSGDGSPGFSGDWSERSTLNLYQF